MSKKYIIVMVTINAANRANTVKINAAKVNLKNMMNISAIKPNVVKNVCCVENNVPKITHIKCKW
jgi:hypothetical protein